MDSDPELPDNSIVLSQEDLARLGVNVDSLTTTSSEQSCNGGDSKKKLSKKKNTKTLDKTPNETPAKANLDLSPKKTKKSKSDKNKTNSSLITEKFEVTETKLLESITENDTSILANNSSLKRPLESAETEPTAKKSKTLENEQEDAASPDTSESIAPAPKRPRGRPRKNDPAPKFDIPLFDAFPALDVSGLADDTIVPVKRKKGRPRKNPLPADDSESTKSESKAEDTTMDLAPEDEEEDEKDQTWKFANEEIFQVILNDEVVKSSGEKKSAEGSAKKGRKPKFSKELEDIEGSSTCVVCNLSIPNKEWFSHRLKVHNNLTYRKGDQPLDLGDHAVVQRAFKEAKATQKFLQCFKCQFKTGSIPEFSRHLEACNDVVKDGLVTCAVCLRQVDPRTWSLHRYSRHNNLAWRLGDTPLDLQDKSLIIRIFQALYKVRKPLRCEICSLQKKSTMGYVSHKIQCIASLSNKCSKVECKLCGKFMLPVSMEFHVKSLHSIDPMAKYAEQYLTEGANVSGPRKAAESAMEVIHKLSDNDSKVYCMVKDCEFRNYWVIKALKSLHDGLSQVSCLYPNCDFTCPTENMYDIARHLDKCVNKPVKHYICKLCLVFFENEPEVQSHCQDVHKTGEGDTEDVTFQELNEDIQLINIAEIAKDKLRVRNKVTVSKNPARSVGKPLFLNYSLRELPPNTLIYFQAFPWMYSFCERHFRDPFLFQNLRNDKPWQVLDCDLLNKYLPYHHESCDISVRPMDFRRSNPKPVFRKLELLESCSFYEGEATIFCGGPITAMKWMPTPYTMENMNQIVAVAVAKNAEAVYNVRQSYSEPCVIQFWNCGSLDSKQDKPITPDLLYGLALNAGPVWDIEWCPSGCLDLGPVKENEPSRLGLLAVATCDSLVYIYSVDDVKSEDDRGVIYKSEPVVKLELSLEKGASVQGYYATRISWTKAQGHRYIAVGYSNGVIALFDLLSHRSSPLVQTTDSSGVQVIFSYGSFYGHTAPITGLTLNHLLGGNRWCCSISSDKTLIFWDLESKTVQSESGCLKKFGLTDVVWPTLWPVVLTTEDDASVSPNTPAAIISKSIRNSYVLRENTSKISDSICGLRSLSFSDWLNGVVFGGTSGEVSAQFIQRLIHGADRIPKRKNLCVKQVFSNAKLVPKNQIVDRIKEVTYENITDQYAIDFRDFTSKNQAFLPNQRDKTLDQAEIDKYDIHRYPLNAVNKIVTNPNCQAYPYYAVGYQAGFLRIRSIECLKPVYEPVRVPGHDFATNL